MATVGAGVDSSINWLKGLLGSESNWNRVRDTAQNIANLPGAAIGMVPNEVAQAALSRAYEMGLAGAGAGLGAGAWNMITPGQTLDVDPGTVGLLGALGTGAYRTGLVRPQMDGTVFRGLSVPASLGVDTAGLGLGGARPWA